MLREWRSDASSNSWRNGRDNRVAGVDFPLRNRPATATSVHRLVRPSFGYASADGN
ncbi:hypothetical protein RISK_006718 [Rhodopirellula islandica]|uniref:Uncharacterized protein n=1 Tax=Rhodopirellula islandica TaxID=595434 RepID=A0A0J1E6R5_RHOIS|nr:hypothetical protein RISK_006718 [Rhodopirellula islandica]